MQELCQVDGGSHVCRSKAKSTAAGEGARPTHHLSDPHGHDDVAVLVVLAVGGAELAGGLGIFELEPYVAGADGLQEIQDVLRVEADGQGVALVAGLDRVFRFAGFGGGGGEL